MFLFSADYWSSGVSAEEHHQENEDLNLKLHNTDFKG